MPLRLELLGGFRAFAGHQPAGRALTARHQQIVAYLALADQPSVPRQQVAGVLWPESTDAQALTNLRRELHHLRQAMPEIETALDIGTRTLGWRRTARVELDTADFDRAARDGLAGRRDGLERAAALYRGDLLPGFDDGWIEAERQRLRAQAIRVLSSLVDLHQREREHAQVIDCAQRLLRIDPLHEAGWRALMRAHAGRGERAVALHVYHRCVATLRQEVDAQPEAATRSAYREILEIDQGEPAEAAGPPQRALSYPLLGRQAELAALVQAWRSVESGGPRLALVRGEAGIGKTRLAEELAEVAAAQGGRTATARCYAGEGRLAYAPITAWLQGDVLQAALGSLDATWLAEIARIHPDVLVARPDVAGPSPALEAWQRPRFFEALARAFQAAAPLVLIVDDLQWCDSDTLEWLHFLMRSDVRCLVVGTLRSEEESDNPALGVLLRDLRRQNGLTALDLGRLDESATARLAEAVADETLDADARARVFRQTEGHPLFIVEAGRMGTGSAGYSSGAALPPRVQAVVAARLVQLSPGARDAAELAAVIGRDFDFRVLAHASDLEEGALVRAVDELWRRQIVRARGNDRWDFSHDRIREVAYAGVGPARSRLLHRRVAQALEQTESADRASASIAMHFEQAGHHARAIHYFERAAAVATRLSANEEAIRCLDRGLALLDRLPEGPDRAERELALRGALSGPLTAARGYAAAESEVNLERVAALEAEARGDVPVRWIWALWTMRFVLGDHPAARSLAERALAHAQQDESCRCEAHHALAGSLATMGELDAAARHFEIAVGAYDESRPRQSTLGTDLGVFARAWSSHPLWLLGRFEESAAQVEAAIALADRLDHPFSRALAHAYAALAYQLRRDLDKVRASAGIALDLCRQYGFAYYGEWALIFLGWVACREGRHGEAVSSIEAGIEGLDQQRALARRPYYLSLLAEAHGAAGRPERAVSLLDAAIATAVSTSEGWWLPELYRLKGELGARGQARASFQRALDLAQGQGSLALAARARQHLANA